MKYLPILLIILITGLASCHKQFQNPDPVIGKWQEVKLRLYEIKNGATVYDTTYYHPFTGFDYIQFNSDGSCIIGNDYNYSPNLPAYPKQPQQIASNSLKMDWVNTGVGYVITEVPFSGPPSPGIPPSADTAFLSLSDTLRFQTVGPFALPSLRVVSEAYYVKKQ